MFVAAALLAAVPALAADRITVAPRSLPEWKAVYGRVVARDLIPARARIGGTVVELLVAEGDTVAAGERIALVEDDKLALQITAIDAQLAQFRAQLARAEADLERGRSLVDRGVTTAQRLEQLATDVEVTRNRLSEAEAQRAIVVRQREEGEVVAPISGRILTVPVARGSVILAGEAVATLGGGGFFLRLAIPERHWRDLRPGGAIRIMSGGSQREGRLARIYPQIENGRVLADVEVDSLDAAFVDARVHVEVPVGMREVLLVPASAITTRSGLDFVSVERDDATVERVVVPGERLTVDGIEQVEILSGLAPGETVLVP